jgi:branched-chain amino acid aminotransferase
MEQILYFNSKFVKESEVRISPMTHALHYGTGCFEGIRAYYNNDDKALYIFRMKEHFERFKKSCKLLFITLSQSVDELCEVTKKLVQKNFNETDLYIRPLAYKSDLAVSNFHLPSLKDSLLIYTVQLGRYLQAEEGIRVNVSSWTRVSDNSIPPRAKITGSYINTALAKTESVFNGYDEALFMDKNGHIVEGSAENIFVVKNGKIYTPYVSDDILQGITRDTVMKLCQEELGIAVEERSIDRSEIYQVDEIFLVGTGAEVSPVVEVDKRAIGEGKVGPIAKRIKKLYFDIVHGKNKKYQHWLTKVTK